MKQSRARKNRFRRTLKTENIKEDINKTLDNTKYILTIKAVFTI